MEITVRKRGGFAGFQGEPVHVDSESLGEGDRAELERLVHEAGFFARPPTSADALGADFVNYELTVVDGERRHTISFADDGSEEAAPLRRLAARVEQLGA